MNASRPGSIPRFSAGSMVTGFYAWLVAVFFGLTWIDSVYARHAPQAEEAFREVADFLLIILFIILLAGLGAIAQCWKIRAGRGLIGASLAIIVVAPLLVLMAAPSLQIAPSLGAAVRWLIGIVASTLAFAGFYRHVRAAASPSRA